MLTYSSRLKTVCPVWSFTLSLINSQNTNVSHIEFENIIIAHYITSMAVLMAKSTGSQNIQDRYDR